MKDLEEGFVSYIIVGAFILLLAGGSFFLYTKSIPETSGDNTGRLLEARLRLEEEKTKLAEMKKRHEAEMAVIAQIKKEYENMKNSILKDTDVFFKNPSSKTPKIKITINDKDIEADINRRRLEITNRLKAWEEKNKLISSGSAYEELLLTLPDLVKSAQDDFDYIRDYLDELEAIIGGLSTENSDFTQEQIESYVSIIKTNSEQVEESISNLVIIESVAEEIYEQPETVVGSTTTPATTPVVPPIITPSQIEDQEEAVTQAEEDQAEIEQEVEESTPPLSGEEYLPTQIVMPVPAIIRYLPPTNIDYTGWPDYTMDDNPEGPLLLEGLNKF